MSKFNPCRYCGGNKIVFSFMEERAYNGDRIFTNFEAICACGNRPIKLAYSFDEALQLWNRENPKREDAE